MNRKNSYSNKETKSTGINLSNPQEHHIKIRFDGILRQE